jgi:hypothetical protein
MAASAARRANCALGQVLLDEETPAFPHELDFVIRMTMGPGTTPRKGAEEEDRDVDIPVLVAHELVRAALKRQVMLMDTVHPCSYGGR